MNIQTFLVPNFCLTFVIFYFYERTFDKEKLILDHFIVHKLLLIFLSG